VMLGEGSDDVGSSVVEFLRPRGSGRCKWKVEGQELMII
jgi:hypothetical protein